MTKFQEYIEKLLKYGSIVNFNTPDAPGGVVSDSGSGGVDSDGSSDGIVGTVEDIPNNDDEEGEGNNSDTGDDENNDVDTGDNEKSEDTSSVDDRISALTDQISKLTSSLDKGPDSDKDGEGDKVGISSLEHQDLVAMMADDPKSFIENITSVIRESVSKDVKLESATTEYNSKIEETIDNYAEENPTFEKMWDKGELQRYMDKHPGHNAISAHMTLTMEQRIEDAKKEGAELAAKNFSTKQKNQVLSTGPGITPDQRDAALKNPEKFGGKAAVLAARAGIT